MSDHTQDCIDAFYSDGGQSGCICGADERADRDTLPQVGPEAQAALERIFPPAEAESPAALDVMTLAVRQAAHEIRLCKMVEWVHDEDDEYKTAERFAEAILRRLSRPAGEQDR